MKQYIIINVDNGTGKKVPESHHITKNFQVHELVGTDTQETVLYSLKLIQSAQRVRDKHGKGLIITSGHRELTHNEKVGGYVESEHLYGYAIDCKMPGVSTEQLARDFSEDLGYNSNIGTYRTWVHAGNMGYHRRHTY